MSREKYFKEYRKTNRVHRNEYLKKWGRENPELK